MTLHYDTTRLARLQRLADDFTGENRFDTLAWRVRKAGRVVDEGHAGFDDHEIPPSKAIYRIYSMTKPVISVLALQLIEENRLHLYDPVAAWLPAFAACRVQHADGSEAPAKTVMTIEHLLTHRAGFSYDFLPDCHVSPHYRAARLANDGSRSLDDFIDTLAGLPLAFEPGSAWQYSVSIDVLAAVLEKAGGKPLDELVQHYLLEPLGMRQTGFSVAESDREHILPMHGTRDIGQIIADDGREQTLSPIDVSDSYPCDSTTFLRGGHGLFSTLDDYERFMAMLFDGKGEAEQPLLSAPMVEMMWRNRIPAAQMPLSIGPIPMPGYGWTLFGRRMLDTGTALSLSAEGEGGWSGAASTFFWVDRANATSGIVMTQYLGSAIPLGDLFRSTAYQALLRS